MPTTTAGIKLSELTRQQRIDLLLSATSTRHIDELEREFVGQVANVPRLRNNLFEVARQQADYRQQQLPPESRRQFRKPLSDVDAYRVHALKIPELIQLLQTTADPRIVDEIAECTIDRRARLLTLRKALFNIARQSAQHRIERMNTLTASPQTAVLSRTA